jgi:hypothetical protein
MKGNSPVATLLARWRQEAAELTERYSQAALAGLTSKHIQELEDALQQDADELLNLTEAAAVCGYTDDSLGRMVREGKLENHGRRHAPLVRKGDLPRKPHLREVSKTPTVPLTREQIALAVVNR